MGLFGGYLFPKKIPPFAVAIIGGIVYAYILGRTEIDFSGIGFYAPNPVNGFEALLSGFTIVLPYLSVIIPIEVYNFIETMDNVESANAAGDNYNVREEAQFADGIATMISALFGGVVPNTVWLGHVGLKKAGACIGFSWVGGLLLGFSGIFGLFTFFSGLVPPAVAAITYLWCATIMLSQAFRACEPKHYAGVGIAMVPPIADYLYTQVTGAVGTTGVWTEPQPSGLSGYGAELTQNLLEAGVMWNGVPAVKAGSIIIGIILGTFVVAVIDRRLNKAGIAAFAAAGLSMFGLIHSALLGFYPTSPFVLAYIIMGCICLLLHTGRDKWFDSDKDFDYV